MGAEAVSSRQGKACIDNAPTAVANRLSKPAFEKLLFAMNEKSGCFFKDNIV
jgi:hypothetical protein